MTTVDSLKTKLLGPSGRRPTGNARRALGWGTSVLCLLVMSLSFLAGCGAPECPEGVTPDPAGNCPIVDDVSPTATP